MSTTDPVRPAVPPAGAPVAPGSVAHRRHLDGHAAAVAVGGLLRAMFRGAPPPGANLNGQSVATPEEAEEVEPGRGRAAAHPHHIGAAGWKDIAWRTWHEFQADQVTTVAGSVAFFTLLAVFPAISAFVSLYGIFADVASAREQLRLLAGVLPADALTLLGDQMLALATAKKASVSFAFAFSLLLSIWSANAGIKALFTGLNIAYGEREKRNFITLNIASLTFTAGLLLFVIVAVGALVVAPTVVQAAGFGDLLGVFAWLRWPLLLFVVIAALTIIYRYGPSRQRPQWRWVTPGGALAGLLWLLSSAAFSLYVANFANYSATYGSLGAVVGFMTWTWLSAVVVLLGAEFDAELEHQTAVDTTTGEAKPLGQRGAAMADTLGESRTGGREKPATDETSPLQAAGETGAAKADG